MQGALRPYVTAGVALVGASVIAASPVAPPVPDMKVSATPSVSAAMQLTATSNPLIAFSQLFGNTVTNATGLFEQFLATPAPILSQVLVNQGRTPSWFSRPRSRSACCFPTWWSRSEMICVRWERNWPTATSSARDRR